MTVQNDQRLKALLSDISRSGRIQFRPLLQYAANHKKSAKKVALCIELCVAQLHVVQSRRDCKPQDQAWTDDNRRQIVYMSRMRQELRKRVKNSELSEHVSRLAKWIVAPLIDHHKSVEDKLIQQRRRRGSLGRRSFRSTTVGGKEQMDMMLFLAEGVTDVGFGYSIACKLDEQKLSLVELAQQKLKKESVIEVGGVSEKVSDWVDMEIFLERCQAALQSKSKPKQPIPVEGAWPSGLNLDRHYSPAFLERLKKKELGEISEEAKKRLERRDEYLELYLKIVEAPKLIDKHVGSDLLPLGVVDWEDYKKMPVGIVAKIAPSFPNLCKVKYPGLADALALFTRVTKKSEKGYWECSMSLEELISKADEVRDKILIDSLMNRR